VPNQLRPELRVAGEEQQQVTTKRGSWRGSWKSILNSGIVPLLYGFKMSATFADSSSRSGSSRLVDSGIPALSAFAGSARSLAMQCAFSCNPPPAHAPRQLSREVDVDSLELAQFQGNVFKALRTASSSTWMIDSIFPSVQTPPTHWKRIRSRLLARNHFAGSPVTPQATRAR